MLVLDPIFEADLPPEQYAYRAGRNAQQAVIDAEETLYRGQLDVVDADLADYFGSIPHADLMRSLARRIVVRIAAHRGQGFQSNVDSDSSGTWTGIWRDRGQFLG